MSAHRDHRRHRCPCCGETSLHLAIADRFGLLLWCHACFRVREEPPRRDTR